MTRIFWDSMLFIYLFQKDPMHWERVASLRRQSLERGDEICTSHLALGEILAGAYRDKDEATAQAIREGMARANIRLLPFDQQSVDLFARIRAEHCTAAADSIHLACAASFGVDLFITEDKKLLKLRIPGIKFIVGIDTDLF
jgi:predicted nucleic acid-binding protein